MRFSFLSLLFLSQQLFAGNETFSAGARMMGMSNAGCALQDPFAWSTNQAGLAGLASARAAVSYQQFQGDLSLRSAAFSFSAAGGVWCPSVVQYGNSLYSENRYGLAYAKAFGHIFQAGVQFDLLSTSIPGYGSSAGITGEAGCIARLSETWTLGTHIYNPFHASPAPGPYEQAPVIFNLGFAWQPSPFLIFTGEAEKDVRYPCAIKAGMEYLPVSTIAIRGGFNTSTESFSFAAPAFCLTD